MAITPVSMQSSSAKALQSQEQRILSQIKSLQSKTEHTAYVNEIKIKDLQQQYNALIMQQQTLGQQGAAEVKSVTGSNLDSKTVQNPVLQPTGSKGNGIDIEA